MWYDDVEGWNYLEWRNTGSLEDKEGVYKLCHIFLSWSICGWNGWDGNIGGIGCNWRIRIMNNRLGMCGSVYRSMRVFDIGVDGWSNIIIYVV